MPPSSPNRHGGNQSESSKRDPIADGPRPAIVYLVHGTWGRGIRPGKTVFGRPRREPAWSDVGSPFSTALHAALSESGFVPTLRSVNWSGSNSFMERDREARILGKLLDDDDAQNPAALQLVIAHSHGGNIALDAIRHYRLSETDVHLVTLATPYIDLWSALTVSDGGRYTEEFGRAYAGRHSLTRLRRSFVSLALALALFWIGIRAGLLAPFPVIVASALSTYGTYFMAALLVIDMAMNLLLVNTGAGDDALMRVPRLGSAPAIGLARSRILVLRGTDDEAGLALAAGSVQAVLGSGIWRATLPALALLIFLPAALAAAPQSRVYTILLFAVRAASVFLLGSLLESIGRATAGREFLLMGYMLKISVNSAPDFDGDMTVKTLPADSSSTQRYETKIHTIESNSGVQQRVVARESIQGRKRLARRFQLRHSLYTHPDCIPSIVRWLHRSK